MTAVFFIKPATPGLKVRDPVTKQHLKPEGEQKPRTTHWLRRLAAGEVTEVSAADPAGKIETKAAAKATDKKGGE